MRARASVTDPVTASHPTPAAGSGHLSEAGGRTPGTSKQPARAHGHRDDPGATVEDIGAVVERVETAGGSAFVSRGVERSIIGLVGRPQPVRGANLDVMPGVADLVRVSKPYKLVSRENHSTASAVAVGGVPIGPETFTLIAGRPVAVETPEQTERPCAYASGAAWCGCLRRSGGVQHGDAGRRADLAGPKKACQDLGERGGLHDRARRWSTSVGSSPGRDHAFLQVNRPVRHDHLPTHCGSRVLLILPARPQPHKARSQHRTLGSPFRPQVAGSRIRDRMDALTPTLRCNGLCLLVGASSHRRRSPVHRTRQVSTHRRELVEEIAE